MKSNAYENFILAELPNLWSALAKNNFDFVLSKEVFLYHYVCKNPDNSDSFRRFYTVIEPILLRLGIKFWHKIKSLKVSELPSLNRYIETIIIFKGPLNFANGQTLISQLRQLQEVDSIQAKKILLFCIDVPDQNLTELRQELPDINIVSTAKFNTYTQKYFFILRFIQSLNSSQWEKINICYWGIPFGMLFLYKLLQLEGHQGIRQITITKYLYSFNSAVCNRIICGPEVNGQDYCNNNIVRASSVAFSRKSFEAKPQSRDLYIRSALKSIKKDKAASLYSSLARSEKILDKSFLDFVNNCLVLNDKAFYLVCSRSAKQDSNLDIIKNTLPESKLIVLEWCDLPTIIDLIDIYIDPFPEGGGYSLMLALKNNINSIILSPQLFPESSSLSKSLKYCIQNEFDISDSLKEEYLSMLSTDINSALSRIESLINNQIKKDSKGEHVFELYNECSKKCGPVLLGLPQASEQLHKKQN